MFNRRKVDLIAEDIYLLGYSLANKRFDKRLSKAMKLVGVVNETVHDETIAQPELPELTETCIFLQLHYSYTIIYCCV